MNEEIKEILDRLEYDKDDIYYIGFADGINIDNTFLPKDVKLLLNYITNLQEENEELNRVVELYGKSLYNADLTRYKEENSKLKETNEEHRKINGQLREENELLREKLIQIEDVMLYKYRQTQTYDDCETYNELFR